MGSSRTRSAALAARSSPKAATAYLASSPLSGQGREIGLTRPLNSKERARPASHPRLAAQKRAEPPQTDAPLLPDAAVAKEGRATPEAGGWGLRSKPLPIGSLETAGKTPRFLTCVVAENEPLPG